MIAYDGRIVGSAISDRMETKFKKRLLVRSSLDRAVLVRALAWARHFTLTVPLSTHGRVVQKPIKLTQN